MTGKPFLRLSFTTSSVAGDTMQHSEDPLSQLQHSEAEQACSFSGDLALLFEVLLINLENDSLNIFGIKLDDGETLDKGVPTDERDIKQEELMVLGSDLLLGLWHADGVFCPDVGVDARVEE
eukprot:TRINITY_DN11818_c0_g1_i1.p2 TRINITY_DN11818_c0_g1~~TRINITY_DN11818_c0_g1_i1.p2  ORF type:complete len:122 (-),score=27.96 TRINITY_DN11818_c0_g1_i1:316-681(-)